ncbi:hypothetical protein Sjap_018842 [Stephania japonica]|uniref:Protein kinase domain-containing protein n=1 Tax=Stephania japonica TaxID=461633 RepID=A0AAP0NJX0_9MAGN
MVLVRQRRHQEALKLPLPPPASSPFPFHQQRVPFPLPLVPSEPDSPSIEKLSDLEKLAVLGHGSSGIVYKVRHRRNLQIYALKVVRFEQDNIAAGIRRQADLEADILKQVNSQFIVRCYGVFDSCTEYSEASDLCFLMEYMEGGSLQDLLKIRRRLPEAAISDMARRVLEGLKYLHEMHIVHRDIKPSNLLINRKGEVKIADFGVSCRDGCCDFSCAGTCAYMSPERFDPERWNISGTISDGFAGDIWALGVALLECHAGHFPLIPADQKLDWATLMCAICFCDAPEMPSTASAEFRSFIYQCLEKDWRRRGSVGELLSHPFVAKNKSSSTEQLIDEFL